MNKERQNETVTTAKAAGTGRWLIVGGVLLLIGMLLLLMKSQSPAYIDSNGILHEAFYLVPFGFMCIAGSLLTFAVVGIKKIKNKINSLYEKEADSF